MPWGAPYVLDLAWNPSGTKLATVCFCNERTKSGKPSAILCIVNVANGKFEHEEILGEMDFSFEPEHINFPDSDDAEVDLAQNYRKHVAWDPSGTYLAASINRHLYVLKGKEIVHKVYHGEIVGFHIFFSYLCPAGQWARPLTSYKLSSRIHSMLRLLTMNNGSTRSCYMKIAHLCRSG